MMELIYEIRQIKVGDWEKKLVAISLQQLKKQWILALQGLLITMLMDPVLDDA